MDWTSCYGSDKIPWLNFRDSFLFIFLNPEISIILSWLCIYAFFNKSRLKLIQKIIITSIFTLIISLIYSPFTTSQIEHYLNNRLILSNKVNYNNIDLILIPGRGEKIAKFTTEKAKTLYQKMDNPYIYISGDNKSTAIKLVENGLNIKKIIGDSCAQTTLENIYFTQNLIAEKSIEGKIFVITDKWHLPRISRTFYANNLKISGVGINPNFSRKRENKIAIRELLAYLLYEFQGRL